MTEFRMPSLGADMEAGTIVEWRVQPGDEVHRGDIVAVVDTEKSTIEVEVFDDGVVGELLVEPGVEVPVGTVLATIVGTGSPAPAPVPPTEVTSGPPAAATAVTPPRPEFQVRSGGDAFVRASPRARREAAARGIDMASLAGTGPDAVVVADDVVPSSDEGRAQPAPRPLESPDADRRNRQRRAIGELMGRSKRTIPHYYLATTVDLGAAMGWLADANDQRPVSQRLLPVALLLKATALAALEIPAVNGTWQDGFHPSTSVHLGVAVSLRGGGLVAPAIHDVALLELDDLMAALRDLVQRARGGTLRSSEMADSTLTVTNLGEQGVDELFGVIYPPQVALVGFGTIRERPWVSAGALGVRPTVRATLAADHRASDGHEGARFLAAVDRLLQEPEQL
jgi:pyruvate dehydrogenase E2 component (dihydrolipoamide acetyltransferase)